MKSAFGRQSYVSKGPEATANFKTGYDKIRWCATCAKVVETGVRCELLHRSPRQEVPSGPKSKASSASSARPHDL